MTEQNLLFSNKNQRPADFNYYEQLGKYFEQSPGSTIDKLRNFTKYAPLGELNKFLVKSEIFNEILHVHGSIVECGVFLGGGLMTWGALSAIREPINHNRKIYGFDTFDGFPSVSEEDNLDFELTQKGALKADSYEDIQRAASLYDSFRPLGHIPKIHLVRGDVKHTFPAFIQENKHLVVSLLYLDFDLYEPTKLAIETFFDRMPKGAVIAFDELNVHEWAGETSAVLDTIGIKNLEIRRSPFYPNISWAKVQ